MIPTPPISVTSSCLGGIEGQRKVQYNNNVLKKSFEEEEKEIVNVMISFRDKKKCRKVMCQRKAASGKGGSLENPQHKFISSPL